MPFDNFTNPYQHPADVPEEYRHHPTLRKLFKADGSYVRPAEDPVTVWVIIKLVEEYGVPLEAMELELHADFSEGTHQGGRRYQGRAGGATTKWLNLRTLCESYLYLIGGDAQIASVYYFSALATHLQDVKPDVIKRHMTLIECLRVTGVTVELGRFKQKTVHCDSCHRQITRHEEKETDVAISVRLLELFVRGACDTAVVVTGDTDVAPAVRSVQQLFPAGRVLFAFPYGRKNQELAKLAPGSFSLRKEQYAKFQFPNPFVTPDGRKLYKPAKW